MKKLIFLFMAFASLYVHANPLGYDVIYVRYPSQDPNDEFVTIPQGEQAYDIAAGADLMLLKADSTEIVLVDCTVCSVMDPYISYDGNTVFYSLIEESGRASAGWIYKIHLDDPSYTPIRLTFNDGFDSDLYAGNTTAAGDQSSFRGVRDMSPVPLADGRLLFTSNRGGLSSFSAETDSTIKGSVQHMYTMDDHEGELNTSELSNIKQLEKGSMNLVQHPIQLKDGRILFSTWQDAGNRFHYAMTSLFTIYPDGTNLMQFTEPHDKDKHLDHFITQLPNESVVAGYYYPSFDYGFGVLHRMPINPQGRDVLRGSVKGSRREFDRKGTINITPHTTPADRPAPNRSGKYSMPSIGAKDSLLVAYSLGYVNHFSAVCDNGGPIECEALRSGIYMIPRASTNIIYDPSELVLVKDDVNYNEIWPRAVLSYQEMYGVATPNIIPMDRSNTNNATAYTGTSSMFNRESSPNDSADPDPFQTSKNRETHNGNWTIQGADAGAYTNSDIHAVRIVGTPALPFNDPIRRNNPDHDIVSGWIIDSRMDSIVAKYGSLHGEKWQILGEFPLTHGATTDAQGNPDTSWIAKIPAETPHFLQALDINGMTLNSELTWRSLKAGEKRVDCGGCHVHSTPELDIATTQAGQGVAIAGVTGLLDSDFRIANGLWNLTTGSIPVLTANGTEFINQNVLSVEFKRDVYPVLQADCSSCHNNGGNAPDFSGTSSEVYNILTDRNKVFPETGKYIEPQISRYIRNPQARQSLLAWVAYGARLDGRLDADRSNDLDYPTSHPVLNVSDANKRSIARWIDMGAPIDFPNTNGFGYTEDSQLPVVERVYITNKPSQYAGHYSVGLLDANSGLNMTTLAVSYYAVSTPNTVVSIVIDQASKVDDNKVVHVDLGSVSVANGAEYVLKISIEDLVGNKNVLTERLTKGAVIL